MFGGLLPLAERRKSEPAPQPSIFEAIYSNRRIRAVFIVILSSCLFLTIVHVTSNIDNILGPTKPPQYVSHSDVSESATKPKEAYAFYLSTEEMDPHYLRTALILLFALTTDPILKDLQGRDVVVLTPHSTPKADIISLKQAGANIFPIPRYVDTIQDEGNTPLNFDLGKYEYSKTWLWTLEYDRVVYLSSDLVLNKPLGDVWIDAHAEPMSGLAATADIEADPNGGRFGEGFIMIRPDKKVYEELKEMERDEESFIDENVLDKYFSRDGDRPWEPLNNKFLAMHPDGEDIKNGVYTLQEKGWTMEANREVANIWWESYGRMVGWKETMEEYQREEAAKRRGSWW